MADTINLQHGAVPWGGDLLSAAIRVYDFHDVPQVGVIEQAGAEYLFQCLAGHVERLSVWKYTLIDADEIAQLDSLEDTDFDLAVDQFSDRPGVLAVAIEGHGLIAEREFYDTDDMSSHFAGLLDDVEAFATALREGAEVQRQRLTVG